MLYTCERNLLLMCYFPLLKNNSYNNNKISLTLLLPPFFQSMNLFLYNAIKQALKKRASSRGNAEPYTIYCKISLWVGLLGIPYIPGSSGLWSGQNPGTRRTYITKTWLHLTCGVSTGKLQPGIAFRQNFQLSKKRKKSHIWWFQV